MYTSPTRRGAVLKYAYGARLLRYTNSMWFYEVAPTKIVRSGVSTFTYHAVSQLKPGHIVTIPVGKQTLQGVVITEVKKPS